MYRRLLLLLVLTLSISAMLGCVRQDEYASLQKRLQQQDRQLQQIQPAQADSWAQMQSMRQELNQLRGQLDDLALAGGAKQIATKLNRHEAALRQIESSMALDLQLDNPIGYSSTGTPGQAGLSPYSQHGLSGNSVDMAYPIIAQNNAVPTDTNDAEATMLIDKNGNVIPPKDQVKKEKVDLEKVLYDAGMAAYVARKYADAQRSFSDFTKNYPTSKNIPNAWFYIGECYFQLNKFADAALAYDTVITKYSTSSRTPLAYLKQGIAFSKLGKSDAAKARIEDLIKKYPNTPEASRARNFLKTNK